MGDDMDNIESGRFAEQSPLETTDVGADNISSISDNRSYLDTIKDFITGKVPKIDMYAVSAKRNYMMVYVFVIMVVIFYAWKIKVRGYTKKNDFSPRKVTLFFMYLGSIFALNRTLNNNMTLLLTVVLFTMYFLTMHISTVCSINNYLSLKKLWDNGFLAFWLLSDTQIRKLKTISGLDSEQEYMDDVSDSDSDNGDDEYDYDYDNDFDI